MKDFIYLNYGIYIEKIYSQNGSEFFFFNNYKFNIEKCYEQDLEYINKLIIITNDLYKNINVNTFILNKEKKYLTKYNDYYLAIIRVNNIENYFDLNDIIKFWNINTNLEDFNILNEWEKEIDNLENKLIEYNDEFKEIQKSINYYIGMAENAIQLLGDYKASINQYNNSIGHKLSYKLFDDNKLFNPFNFIKTNKMYDIAHYIKFKFLKNELDYNEIEQFFVNGTEYENIFLFCNLLYPSIYFSLVINIFEEKEDETKINTIIRKRKNYVKLLSFCKKMVKNSENINLINWFN